MYLIFLIFGLFWGSFLNNIAYRLIKGESFFLNRSKCPSCGHVLKAKDLIPLLSFILQKGKCRYCQSKISLRYPFTEISTSLFTFFLSLVFKPLNNFYFFLLFLFYFFLLSILFILALYDFDTYLVDDRFLLLLFLLGALFIFYHFYFKLPFPNFSYLLNYFFIFPPYLETIFSSFLLSSIFLFIYLLTRGEGLGFGDIKTVFTLGLFLKPGDAFLFLVFSSLFGSIYGFIIFFKEKNLKKPIPFIPFFFLGFLATILFGNYLTYLYINLFSF